MFTDGLLHRAPTVQSFDILLRLHKLLNENSSCRWCETPMWRHCNVYMDVRSYFRAWIQRDLHEWLGAYLAPRHSLMLWLGWPAFKFTCWRHQMEAIWRYWSFVRGIHRSPVDSPHKGQWHELWCFFRSASEQTVETPVIWDAIELIMTSL